MPAPLRSRAHTLVFCSTLIAIAASIPATGCFPKDADPTTTDSSSLVQNPTITVITSASATRLIRGGTLQVDISARFSGGPTRATLSLGGALPAGVTATFSTTTITSTSTALLTLSASATAAVEQFAYNVIAVESGGSATGNSQLTIAQVEYPFVLQMSAGQSATVGTSTSFTLSTTRGIGFTAPISLALVPSSVPAGSTSSFSTPTLVTGTATLQLDIPANATPGRWLVRVVGTSGSIVDTIAGLLNIQAAPVPPDITVSGTPSSVTVAPGASATYDLGFTRNAATIGLGSIAQSVASLPAGATPTFTAIDAANTSRLTVATTPGTPDGIYKMIVTATLDTIVRTTSLTLIVQTPANFNMSLTPATVTVARGASATVDVGVQRIGPMGDVAIDAQTVTAGVTVVAQPTVISAPATGTKVSVGVGSTAAPGTYAIVIRCTGGGVTKTATLTLTIPTPPPNNVTMDLLTSSATVPVGGTTQIPIKLTRTGSGVGLLVEFRTVGIPIGGNAWVSPSFTTGDSATLHIIGGLAGKSTVAVTAVVGAFPPTTLVSVDVQASSTPNFSVTPAPQTLNMSAGETKQMGVEIGRVNGFNGAVSFQGIGDTPGKFNVTFSLNSTTGSGILMYVQAAPGISAGPHTITVRGTSGALVRETTMTVVIESGGVGGGCTSYPYCYGYGIKVPPE